ncbi:DUF6941 family protein [Ferrimicrobium acidiphilum]|uniref:DUF6941 family protein n=1 Tax=Ferrimicrobium acidiphilum TaxID=121039 RepID=UPI0023F4FD57|nr:hypothetical protein [Ferrimicrobium acidiphilum]
MKAQAMLCDYAQVHGGKLNIIGAGGGLVVTPATAPPYLINLSLAVLMTVPWSATNQQHRLTIELVSEPGGGGGAPARRVDLTTQTGPGQTVEDKGKILVLFNAGRPPQMLQGEDTLVPLALPLFAFPAPDLGSYYFAIDLDGTEVDRVSFRVVSQLRFMPGNQPPALS